MRKKNIFIIAITFLLFSLMTTACSNSTSSSKNGAEKDVKSSEQLILTDVMGRNIKLKGKAKTAVAIGPGTLRLYCYASDPSKIVGIESLEGKNSEGRPYINAYPNLKKLPIIGQGGPKNSPDPEGILGVKPDVIFSSYALEKAKIDELEHKTGIPVVAISKGTAKVFDPSVCESLEVIGKVMGTEEKANTSINLIKGIQKDLMERTRDIPPEGKPKIYIGCVNASGAHGIESTNANDPVFKALNVFNVTDETGKKETISVDKEKILQWNPDKIFIEYSGMGMLKEDMKKNLEYYKGLKAFKTGEIYGQLPTNFYGCNFESTLINAYFTGKVIYPEKFKDIVIEKKAKEIYETLLGQDFYKSMISNYGKLDKVDLKN